MRHLRLLAKRLVEADAAVGFLGSRLKSQAVGGRWEFMRQILLRPLIALVATALLMAIPFLLPQSWETAATILAILSLFIGLPTVILLYLDGVRTWQAEHPEGKGLGLLLARLPMLLFGALSMGIGVAIVGWVIYNVFVARDPAYTGPPNASALAVTGFGIGPGLVVFGWGLWRRPQGDAHAGPSPEEHSALR